MSHKIILSKYVCFSLINLSFVSLIYNAPAIKPRKIGEKYFLLPHMSIKRVDDA